MFINEIIRFDFTYKYFLKLQYFTMPKHIVSLKKKYVGFLGT